MASIESIYKHFSEIAFRNQLEAKVEPSIALKGPTPIYLLQWDKHYPKFSMQEIIDNEGIEETKEIVLKLSFQEELCLEVETPPSFNYLFWIEPIKNANTKVVFKYIECGNVKPYKSLNIAYADAFIRNKTNFNSKELDNKYIFDAGKYKLLFIRLYENGKQDWNLFGFTKNGKCKFADVQLKDNDQNEKIRILVNERSGVFPSDINELQVFACEEIAFVDRSRVTASHEILIRRQEEGKLIMNLWNVYSDMQLKQAQKNQEELGIIRFKRFGKPLNGKVNIKLLEMTRNQSQLLERLSKGNPLFQLYNDSGTEDSSSVNVQLLSFNSKEENTACFEDELYQMPKEGYIQLSILGDSIVDKRRKRALKYLSNSHARVLTQFWLAVESGAEEMINDEPFKNYEPKWNKLNDFLSEKFGISELTEEQRKAVKLAINNEEDITIIQGPPGTGKSTVVSAICFCLMERDKEKHRKRKSTDKIILASAFQNDTIEHIASKIYTHGLPTVKIGKKNQSIRAEEIYVQEMKKHLNKIIDSYGGSNIISVPKMIESEYDKFIKEKNFRESVKRMKQIMDLSTHIDFEYYESLMLIIKQYGEIDKTVIKVETLINSIPENNTDYNIRNGFEALLKLRMAKEVDLTEEEKALLDSAPEENPNDDFLAKLVSLKERLKSNNDFLRKKLEENCHVGLCELMKEVNKKMIEFEETNIDSFDDFVCSVLSSLIKDIENNKAYIRSSIQDYGDTIAATNQLSGSMEMQNYSSFENVILEEAARSNPLDLLIPITCASNRIIMVGDHKQLPQLLEEDIAEKCLNEIIDPVEKMQKMDLYKKSLFEIIFNNVETKNQKIRQRAITLSEQFRMHPDIANLISRVYYNNVLRSGESNLASKKLHNLNVKWAKDKRFVFCNVDGSHKEVRTSSVYREAEAQRIMELMDELQYDPEFKYLSVGIITFYSGQEQVLLRMAKEKGYILENNEIHPDYKFVINKNGQKTDKERFRIGTVDSFQGKEFDVVILSTVRSNDKRIYGFLEREQRLNVAFSRAQKLLIIVGDAEMYTVPQAENKVRGLFEIYNNICSNSGCEYGTTI